MWWPQTHTHTSTRVFALSHTKVQHAPVPPGACTTACWPHFSEERLDRRTYTDLGRNDLPTLLEKIDLRTSRLMWMQQDGAPHHFIKTARHAAKDLFPNIIGRGTNIVASQIIRCYCPRLLHLGNS
ncbi:hypothetical protein PR048_016274 [Dryococelus australis]|uniref:Uncharacterized protein n=1 Tax=Dryococelus australis TaxID=614101 RepID=A0ABQ9HJA4_9NEOP|nr:hypothetical protein PR048_016274 [Dryococelus australis]